MNEDFDLLGQISKNLAAKKVGIEEFCESNEYCGKRIYPRQKLLLKLIFLEELTNKEEDVLDYWIQGGRDGNEIVISPMIRERVQTLRDMGYSHFREVVLVGGRRSSKGFVTGMALTKKMFDVVQLQDPGTHYGIDPDKEIYFSCIAGSQEQAKKFQYADFSSTVSRCEAMQEYIYKLQELEFSVATDSDKQRMARIQKAGRKVGRDTSKLRGVALAANASTLRGSATIALCFDEMAHMQQEGESAATAESVYEAAIPSLAQFGKDAMIFCNSSPYTKIGKFYQRYEEGLTIVDKTPAAPLMMTFQYPSWALFEGWQDDPERRFRKAITVSPDWDPDQKNEDGSDYHSEEDKDAIVIAREEERQDPDKYKVERRGQFAEIVDAFLRPEMVDRAYLGRPTRDGGYNMLKNNWNNSSFQYKYKAHLDPSSTTAGFGFSMGHVEEIEDIHGQSKTHVVIDIVQRWKPNDFPEGVVDWEVVLRDIIRYINIFQPYEVTFDQFQSQAPMQWLNTWLRQNNMSDIRVYEKTATAMHNWNRAEVFRTALYQDLIHIPSDTADCQWSNLELKNLQQINTAGRYPRIDKQEIGPVQTKDMADCIMEVVEALIGNVLANQNRATLGELPVAIGAQGGYQIGGNAPRSRTPAGVEEFYGKRTGEQKAVAARSSARENLDKIAGSRSGTWSARGGRSGRGNRGRGY